MDSGSFLLFTVEERYYALHVSQVERILPVAQMTPVQNVPHFIVGLLNLAGSTLPVLDMRLFLGFPKKEIELDQYFIYTSSLERPLLLLVDGVQDVVQLPVNSLHLPEEAQRVWGGHITSYSTIEDRIVLIKDMDDFIDWALVHLEGGLEDDGREGG